jgi:hypothetical protein
MPEKQRRQKNRGVRKTDTPETKQAERTTALSA